MKKIFYPALCVAGLMSVTSCDDYLETSSPSVVDADFVFRFEETANAAMVGVYEQWRAACQANFFGDGTYYSNDVAGSDMERHPEKFTNQPNRHYPETFYQNGSYTAEYNLLGYLTEDGHPYTKGYQVIAPANAVINAVSKTPGVAEAKANGAPTTQSQLWGEAICARACTYRELIKNLGDVPMRLSPTDTISGLTSRYKIYDQLIKDLEEVIPLMYRVGETPNMTKNKFSRTFAEGLVARICLDAAGYQTRRADFNYVDGSDQPMQFEDKGKANANAGGALYGRPANWKSYVEKAKKYFNAVIENPGSAKFYTVDPRSAGKNGQLFDNPYQFFFQQMNDLEYADESIYEYAQTQGTGNDARNYSYGRPSSGGGSNAFPCKAYGQGRINPVWYWGIFDPQDRRRDVSICATASTGKGSEKLIPFTPNSKADGGGLSLNKWDECRMSSPYVLKQRTSGINGPYMRMAEMYLGYAEACALLNEDGPAKETLRKVHDRSFPAGKSNFEQFYASCGSTLEAVIQERGFEFAGEGDRRWTLIRSGLVGEKIKYAKDLTKEMIKGLRDNGHYTFKNGNQISAYVWTKLVDAKSQYGYRLTTQCPEGMEEDPVLFPGWRGQNDDWLAVGRTMGVSEANIEKNLTAGDKTNLAIKGLMRYIDPNGEEAKALEADGYEKVEYGKQLVDNEYEYYTTMFLDYDYESAPIYLWPLTPNTISTSNGTISNGYGFKQE